MMLRLNFNNLVCGLLPWYKRQPVRLGLLRSMAFPLGGLFADFDIWRNDTAVMINVNSQVAVLEGYLRKRYGQPIAIKIVTFDDGALEICLEAEGDARSVLIALDGESAVDTMVPLPGELRQLFGDADFLVYVPTGVDLDLLQADIERFKQAMTQYKIIQK